MPEPKPDEIVEVHTRLGTPEELVGVTSGLVYILEDTVALDIKDFGRIQFPMDMADTVGRAMIEGSRMLREGGAKEGLKIL